jgi:hypothetical protein
MRFYNIDPEQIRKEASSGKPAHELLRNGKGALFATQRVFHNSRLKERLEDYLRALLPTLANWKWPSNGWQDNCQRHEPFWS